MDSKIKIKSGTFIGVCLIAAITFFIVIVAGKKKPSGCNFQANPPSVDLYDLQSVVSDEYDAIAKLGGYLAYPTDASEKEYQYIPLTLQKVKLSQMDKSYMHLLTLSTDCAELELTLMDLGMFDPDRPLEKLTCRRVSKLTIKGLKKGAYAECSATVPGIGSVLPDHYGGKAEQKYTCKFEDGDTGAVLVAEYLEFEINGDKTSKAGGSFSTESGNGC